MPTILDKFWTKFGAEATVATSASTAAACSNRANRHRLSCRAAIMGSDFGNFRPQRDYCPFGLAFAAGDFNGDGVGDLAASDGGDVSVLLGNMDGSFQPSRNFGAEAGASMLAVGDFNGDRMLDVVGSSGFASRSVSVFINNTHP